MSKPFIERLTLDQLNLKVIKENRPKNGGFQAFKSSFLGQIWNNVKANWLMLLFCLPILGWIVYSQWGIISANLSTPYSGNIGIGYPVVTDAHISGAESIYRLSMNRALYMLPLIVVASVGLAGIFNVIKYYTWGFKIKISKTFFRGIKNSFAPFIWVGTALGLCYMLLTFVFTGLNYYQVDLWLKIIAYIISILITYAVILISIFITTQAAVFDLTPMQILKNSFFLAAKFWLQNTIIGAIGLISMILPLLTFNSWLQIAAYTIFFMMAFSYTATVWTVYTHNIYEIMLDSISHKETHRANAQKHQPIAKAKVISSGQNLSKTAENENAKANNEIDNPPNNQSGQFDGQAYNKSANNYNKKYHNPKKRKKS